MKVGSTEVEHGSAARVKKCLTEEKGRALGCKNWHVRGTMICNWGGMDSRFTSTILLTLISKFSQI